MSKQQEALRLALEALERALSDDRPYIVQCKEAIAAIREALAEQPAQQQEPVVWMYVNKSTHETKFQKHMSDFVDHSLWSEVPLYGEPLANHELQCVCGAVWCGDEMVHLPDKRPPASKPWVGLTEEDIEAAMPGGIYDCLADPWDCGVGDGDYMRSIKNDVVRIVRAIEAKLKEKNI